MESTGSSFSSVKEILSSNSTPTLPTLLLLVSVSFLAASMTSSLAGVDENMATGGLFTGVFNISSFIVVVEEMPGDISLAGINEVGWALPGVISRARAGIIEVGWAQLGVVSRARAGIIEILLLEEELLVWLSKLLDSVKVSVSLRLKDFNCKVKLDLVSLVSVSLNLMFSWFIVSEVLTILRSEFV